MITSLFSSFDPLSGFLLLNYTPLVVIFTFFILSCYFSLNPRSLIIGSETLYTSIQQELEASINNSNNNGNISLILSVFFIILTLNLMGLLPYVFTLTAHLAVTLSLALPFWFAFLLFSATNTPNLFLSHLVPTSTPLPLSQFIVLIETTSLAIRPITLSVRLAANITAGHILIALSSSTISILNLSSSALLILLTLEFAVAIIQSYVFTVLTTMYLSEV